MATLLSAASAEAQLPTTLSLAVTTPAGALSPFKPGATGTSVGLLTAVSPSSWTLQVSDTSATSPAPGHLLRQSCSTGVASLAQALKVTATPAVGTGTSNGQKSISATAQTVATGPAGTSAVTVSYSQTVGAGEAIPTGCTYQMTVTYTLS
jgi:hypothetical protein